MRDDRQDAPAPALIVMAGPPGTGKSHLVREIARRVSVDTVQTDDIRRRLVAHPEYTPDENRKVFAIAHGRTEQLLRERRSVIFDATNIYEWTRRGLYQIAERTGARLLVVRVVAPESVVADRLRERLLGADPKDRSEAGWDIYLRMKAEFEEIQRPHLVVDSSQSLDPAAEQIARFIEGRT